MDAPGAHVVIVGGPEADDELLAMVLDDGEAVPVFESVEAAQEFLNSTGDFGTDWRPREVSAAELSDLLDYQGEEVKYVALSPPPENLAGGMEVQVIPRELLASLLLRRQTAGDVPSEREGFWRRLFG